MNASPQFSDELKSIKQKHTELTRNQPILDQRLNRLSKNYKSDAHSWTIQHTVNHRKENQDNIVKQQEMQQQTHESEQKKHTQEIGPEFDLPHQQQIEQMIDASTVIKNLYESISNIHQLLVKMPATITEATIDAAIAKSERRIIEKLTQDVDAKFNRLQAEIEELSPAVNDRITQLEKRFNDFLQSNNSYVTRPTVEDLIRKAIPSNTPVASKTQVAPQPDIDLQKRIILIEQRLDKISLVKDSSQTEPRPNPIHNITLVGAAPSPSLADPNTTKTVYIEDSRITSLQKQVNDHTGDIEGLHDQINKLKQAKIDFSGDKNSVKTIEVKDLAKYDHHECQDARVPGVINEINNHSTIIENLRNQIRDLDHKKPDLPTVERLIQESIKSMSGNERFDARILELQAQISSLEKRLE
jgi:chromosome segregation ATPase